MVSSSQKSSVTPSLVLAIIAAAFGSSFLFGYNMGVINVPQNIIGQWILKIQCLRNLTFEPADQTEEDRVCPKLSKKEQETMFDKDELNTIWTIISSIFCLGGLIGALSTGYFVDKLGRRGTMLYNNIINIISALLLSLPYVADSYEMLIVGRFIVGINAGINSGVPATYLNEIAPSHLKGALGSLHQLSVTIAILTSQVFGLEQLLGKDWGWPVLFALCAVPTALQLATLPFCPESPKFLYITKNDENGARKALEQLRGTTEVDDEIAEMDVEREQMRREPPVKVLDLFTNRFLLRITVIGAMLMVCQQFSGINAVMFYSTRMFTAAGLGEDAVYATIGMGGINVLMTVFSVFLVEKAGRRTLLLIGFVGMTIIMVLLSVGMILFEQGEENLVGGKNEYQWLSYFSTACVIIFVIFFATGPGSIPWFLVSELFTQGPRGAATSIAVGTNWLCSLIVTLAFPLINKEIKSYTFIIFAGVLLLSTVYIFFQVIETKGKSQEQIQNELKYGNGTPPRYNDAVRKDIVVMNEKQLEVASTAI